eukprot:scaffold15453_cov110-Isochrysis_galbana.AAC.3
MHVVLRWGCPAGCALLCELEEPWRPDHAAAARRHLPRHTCYAFVQLAPAQVHVRQPPAGLEQHALCRHRNSSAICAPHGLVRSKSCRVLTSTPPWTAGDCGHGGAKASRWLH